MVGEEVEGGELGKQVVQYIADSAATCSMTLDADGLTNCRECSRPLVLRTREQPPPQGYGDLTVAFRSDNRWVHVRLHDVAHTPLLSYNLILLPSLTLKGHTYAGDKDGIILKLKGGETVRFPLIGKLCRQYGYRPEAKGRVVDTAFVPLLLQGKRKLPPRPHDGDGVLSSGFKRQSRVVPPVLKGKFQTFKHEFLLKVNMLDISGHFVGQAARVVPVGDPLKQRTVLSREGFSSEEIRGVY